jgi:hypothetical protein
MNSGLNPPQLEMQLAQAVHELKMHLFRLEAKLDLMRTRTDLRTWLILCSIPVSAVFLLILLIRFLRD